MIYLIQAFRNFVNSQTYICLWKEGFETGEKWIKRSSIRRKNDTERGQMKIF